MLNNWVIIATAMVILLAAIAVLVRCYTAMRPSSNLSEPIETQLPLGPEYEALSDRVRQLLSDNQKIAAIKAHMDETGLGLAEAKRLIESIPNSNRVSSQKPNGPSITCSHCGHTRSIQSFRMYNSCPKCKATYGDRNIY